MKDNCITRRREELREGREELRMAKASKLGSVIDPYERRKSEVVLTGYDARERVCYQEVLTYVDYYEDVGHVFDNPDEIASRGIRRMHFVIWSGEEKFQSEAENLYDEGGKTIGGRQRFGLDEPWS